MYGRRSTATEKGGQPGKVPPGYEDAPKHGQPGPEGGRPTERFSVYGTNANPIGGRDPLGQHGMHGGFPSDNEYVNENLTTQKVYAQNEDTLKSMDFAKKESNLLKEDNIKDLGE